MATPGFPIEFVDLLVCQKTGEPLGIKDVQEGDLSTIINGILESPSGIKYKIKDGIVHMLDESALYEEVKQEISSRDKEAGTYDERLHSRYEKEIPSTLDSLKPWAGQTVLDLGCGTGRVSSELYDASLLGVDVSLSSLKVFQQKATNLKSLGLAYADATNFRLKPSSFSRVLSSQVYEHIPTRERRTAFLKLVKESLSSGGVFAATVYHHDLRKRLRHEPKDGYHPSGIFYHYFDSKELLTEFSEVFKIVSVRPIEITLPFEGHLGLSNRMGGNFSRICEHIPMVRQFGHLLLSKAQKL